MIVKNKNNGVEFEISKQDYEGLDDKFKKRLRIVRDTDEAPIQKVVALKEDVDEKVETEKPNTGNGRRRKK